MEEIILTIKEVVAIEKTAKETAPNDCFRFYAQNETLLNETISKKYGQILRIHNFGGWLLHQRPDGAHYTGAIEKVDGYRLDTIAESEDGFTPEEYTRHTGRNVPNWDGDMMVDEIGGKVHFREQNGNISMLMGAPAFSNKYVHLIKTIRSRTDLRLFVVDANGNKL